MSLPSPKMIKLDREIVRKILFYLILSLFLIKFALLPMKRALTYQKELYQEYLSQYRQKNDLLERKKREYLSQEKTPFAENATSIPSYLYSKEEDPLSIQLNLVKKLITKLKSYHLELLRFELPPISYGKTVTEIPVSLHFKGKPKDVLNFFKDLEQEEKKLYIRDCTISESTRNLTVNLVITTFKSEI